MDVRTRGSYEIAHRESVAATSERWGWPSSPCREIEGEEATTPAASYESGPNSTPGLP